VEVLAAANDGGFLTEGYLTLGGGLLVYRGLAGLVCCGFVERGRVHSSSGQFGV
jgi:hypothetical protein